MAPLLRGKETPKAGNAKKPGLLILEEGITYFTVTLAALLPTWMI
jgi:hypothetical protein